MKREAADSDVPKNRVPAAETKTEASREGRDVKHEQRKLKDPRPGSWNTVLPKPVQPDRTSGRASAPALKLEAAITT